jgi:hypothetical protein
MSNSCMENKEDFVFVIFLDNKLQTVRRINNDTEIGHWNILRKSAYSEENVIQNGYLNFLKRKAIKCICNGRNQKESGSRL